MTAEQRNRELLRVKEDMVAAWANNDEEWLKELSQEKQRLKKMKFCVDCGQRTQGQRCNLHEKRRRFYSHALTASLALLLVGCASKPKPIVVGSSCVCPLPAAKLIVTESEAARIRAHLGVDVEHIGNVIKLPPGFGLIKPIGNK